MATIRVTDEIWEKTYSHLFDKPGEHFAFWEAIWTTSRDEPVFIVKDIHLIPDSHYRSVSFDGVEIKLDGVIAAINAVVKNHRCLIEMHNHGGTKPRFSKTDRVELATFVPYLLESLPNRPYAALVWGVNSIFGEYFLTDGTQGVVQSITIIGDHLYQVVSKDDDNDDVNIRFDRQLAWFGQRGQKRLGRIRAGVVGCGGTGSHVIQNLAYLGCLDYLLIDGDDADETNMNRLVLATAADLGFPKALLGRRLIHLINPNARVLSIDKELQSQAAIEALKGVDVIFGCIDNDGARLILNELALAYRIPYIDLAVGIDAQAGEVKSVGGRVAICLPNGPCLNCMGEIDTDEAAYFLSSAKDREEQIERGYVSGMDVVSPAVISLNGLVASAAVNEFAVMVSGIRPINLYTDYDLIGVGRSTKAQWATPMEIQKNPSCVQCMHSGVGDRTNIERYGQLIVQT